MEIGNKVVLLCEGKFGVIESKIASAFIRFQEKKCVAVINSKFMGKSCNEILGWGEGIPILGKLEESLIFKPDTLLIGVSIQGNHFPEEWRESIITAIKNGINIISGLNYMLNEDKEFFSLSEKYGVVLVDAKKPLGEFNLSDCKVNSIDDFIIHTVGTDARVGKKTTSLEIAKEGESRGINTTFAATGQTGIMISGKGVCVDSVIGDYISGAAEQLVLDSSSKKEHWIVVEGQGALLHPAFSGVTLSLLYGAMPHKLVLCHHYNRTKYYGREQVIPPIEEVIKMYESITKFSRQAEVVAISLNCYPLSDKEASVVIKELEDRLSLPVTDVVKFGASKIVNKLESEYNNFLSNNQ